MPPDEGKRNRKHLPGERHQLSQGVQHLCHWWQRRVCEHMGRLQQKATLPVPQVSWWEFKIREQCSTIRYPTSIASLAFAGDGSVLAIASSYMYEQVRSPATTAFIWIHTNSGQPPWDYPRGRRVHQICLRPGDEAQVIHPLLKDIHPHLGWHVLSCLEILSKRNALNQTSPALSHYLLVKLSCI